MMDEHMSHRYALLVGINDYPNAHPDDQLKGCINDVKTLQELLTTRFTFPQDNVELLENPGREAILDAFKTYLIKKARPGDLLVFAFSGHGSYTWDLEGDEPDDYDETLVPSDGHLNPTKDPKHITDDEIFVLNARLQERIAPRGFVVFIIDSCHSGSVTRGVDRARFMEPELPPCPRPGLAPKTNLLGLSGLRSVSYRTWFPDGSRHVLLAACRDDENAYERNDKFGKSHGTFTLFLARALRKAGPGSTYRDVLEMTASSVRRANVDQNPQLDGDGSRAVFGFERFEHEPYLLVQQVKDEGIILGGGSVHLVTDESRFAIHTPQVRSLAQAQTANKPPLTTVVVKEIGSTLSRAVYETPPSPTRRVKKGYRAFEVLHNSGSTRLPTAILGIESYTSVARQALGDSPLLHIVDLNNGPQLVVWAVQPGFALDAGFDLTVPLGLRDRPSFVITGASGSSLTKPIPAGRGEELDTLRENVERIARHFNFLGLSNESLQAVLCGKVDLALKRVVKQGEWHVAIDPEFVRDEPIVTEGDLVALQVTNRYDKPIYFSVFDLGLSWRISLLYPRPGRESEKLAADSTFTIGLRPPGILYPKLSVSIPPVFPAERHYGRETYKVLLTTQPTNFNWLVQPGVKIPTFRGEDPLAGLYALLRSGQTSSESVFRGDDFELPGSRNWWVEQVTFVLKRKELQQ